MGRAVCNRAGQAESIHTDFRKKGYALQRPSMMSGIHPTICPCRPDPAQGHLILLTAFRSEPLDQRRVSSINWSGQSTASAPGSSGLDTLMHITRSNPGHMFKAYSPSAWQRSRSRCSYQVPTKVLGEGILLIEDDTISQARAQATGRLVSLHVKLGDPVDRIRDRRLLNDLGTRSTKRNRN